MRVCEIPAIRKKKDKTNITVKEHVNSNTTIGTKENIHEQIYWIKYKGSEITKIINDVYENIVFFMKKYERRIQ